MSCTAISNIPATECIGNSLATINGNFTSLHTDVCSKVDRAGDTLTGPLNFDGQQIQRFSANVITKASDFILDATHNGAIILVDSGATVTVTFPQGVLSVGFNLVLIQMGVGTIKMGTTGSAAIINVNNALATRKQYAQLNLAVVRADVAWISGDIV
jgi:hypothetical protein